MLEGQRYIADDRLTAADFAVAAPLRYSEQAGIPLANYPSISRWFGDMRALPAWSRTAAMQAGPEP